MVQTFVYLRIRYIDSINAKINVKPEGGKPSKGGVFSVKCGIDGQGI